MNDTWSNEPDYDIPEQRRNCARCGAFLTRRPTFDPPTAYYVEEVEDVPDVDGFPHAGYHRRPANEEEVASGRAERYDAEPMWDCHVCGHSHYLSDMWL